MLIEVVNFFPESILNDLIRISNDVDTNWTLQVGQENLDRLSYKGDLLTPCIEWFKSNPIFENYRLVKFQLWKDGPNFSMDEHIDNDSVELSLQIYLDDRNSPGTRFKDREINYGKNKGYIFWNTDSKIPHSVKGNVPHEGRLSVYALFRKKKDEHMKALLIGAGSKWGGEFTNFLLSKNYKIDLVTGSNLEERLNLTIHKINWKTFSSRDMDVLAGNLSQENYDLIFFNQNSQSYPNEQTFSPDRDISIEDWSRGFWIDCQMPYYLIKKIKNKIQKDTKIGWMLTGLITSQQSEYWKYGGYTSNKNTNLHLMRNFSQYHPGIFFCIDPMGLNPINFQEDCENIFKVIQDINEDDNGKVLIKDGKESNFYKKNV